MVKSKRESSRASWGPVTVGNCLDFGRTGLSRGTTLFTPGVCVGFPHGRWKLGEIVLRMSELGKGVVVMNWNRRGMGSGLKFRVG